jgi:hypothetical protein
MKRGVLAALATAGLWAGIAWFPVTASAASTQQSVAAKVTVTFTDTKLVVTPARLQAGTATLVVVNNGRKAHVLAISGPGMARVKTQKVAAGKRATLTLTLTTGAYELADSVSSGVRWLVVSPATVVSSTGNGSVTVPLTDPTRMDCD